MDDPKKPFEKQGASGDDASGSQDAGSATGIFGRETMPPRPVREDDLLASLLRQPSTSGSPAPAPAIGATPVPTQGPAASSPALASDARSPGPGEVTRILQRLKPAAPKQDLAAVFKQVSIEKAPSPGKPDAPAANPAPSSGSFTQAFRELSAKSAGNPPATPPVPSRPESGEPGEFTKMFQTPSETARPKADLPSAPAPALGSRGDSLTQLFSKAAPSTGAPKPAWSPPTKTDSSFPAPVARNEPAMPAEGGFTQLFQALNETPAPARPVEVTPVAPSGPAAAGGFTQLLQSLSPKEGPAPVTPMTPVPGVPVSAAPASPIPATPIPAPPAASASGPGEYTRVISASALRESQAKMPAAPAPSPAAPPSGARPAMPGMPQMPVPPAMPQVPHAAPIVAPRASAPQVPAMAPPAFSFPPAAAPPPPPAPAPQASGLQKYLPLILLVNIFLMLAILLVLIFVLRHK